jgi:hypothetical protein
MGGCGWERLAVVRHASVQAYDFVVEQDRSIGSLDRAICKTGCSIRSLDGPRCRMVRQERVGSARLPNGRLRHDAVGRVDVTQRDGS